MLQIIQKTYEGANLTTPASGVIALFALSGGTIKTVRVKVDAANTSGATRFNLSKNGVNLFTTELTIAEDSDSVSLTALNIAVSRFDRLILNLETVSAGGVIAPIALQVESDELVLVSQSDAYEAVKAICLAGTNVTRTADDSGKTLTFNASTQITDEQLQDKIAAFLEAGDGITIDYDDAGNILTINASGSGGAGEVDLSSFGLTAPSPIFSDDFTGGSIDTGKWAVTEESSGVASISSNRLSLRPAAGSSSGAYVFSQSPYNFKDAIIEIKVAQAENTTAGFQPVSQLAIANVNSTGSYFAGAAQIDVDAGSGNLRFFLEGSLITSITYNSTTHAYWRFRVSTKNTKIYFETSADGETWTTRTSGTPTINLGALYIFLRCLNVDGSGSQPAAFIIDDLTLYNRYSAIVWDYKAAAFQLISVAS